MDNLNYEVIPNVYDELSKGDLTNFTIIFGNQRDGYNTKTVSDLITLWRRDIHNAKYRVVGDIYLYYNNNLIRVIHNANIKITDKHVQYPYRCEKYHYIHPTPQKNGEPRMIVTINGRQCNGTWNENDKEIAITMMYDGDEYDYKGDVLRRWRVNTKQYKLVSNFINKTYPKESITKESGWSTKCQSWTTWTIDKSKLNKD